MKPWLIKGHRLILPDETDSTNNYATRLMAGENPEEGTIVLTFRQTSGRGNGKNVWESEDLKNLTFSLILYPDFLPAGSQFLISQAISLGILEFLNTVTGPVRIKWPNDLLLSGKKTGGILIENTIIGQYLHSSVIGIGLNINQNSFPEHLSQATSLSLETGRTFDPEETFVKLIQCLDKWYEILKNGNYRQIRDAYLQNLFRSGEWSWFKNEKGSFQAKIAGIDVFGQLLLMDESGNTRAYPFKSVEMVY